MQTTSLRRSTLAVCLLLAPLAAQTGRAVSLGQPARIGGSARFDVAYPGAAVILAADAIASASPASRLFISSLVTD